VRFFTSLRPMRTVASCSSFRSSATEGPMPLIVVSSSLAAPNTAQSEPKRASRALAIGLMSPRGRLRASTSSSSS